jgi:hypothetical protein
MRIAAGESGSRRQRGHRNRSWAEPGCPAGGHSGGGGCSPCARIVRFGSSQHDLEIAPVRASRPRCMRSCSRSHPGPGRRPGSLEGDPRRRVLPSQDRAPVSVRHVLFGSGTPRRRGSAHHRHGPAEGSGAPGHPRGIGRRRHSPAGPLICFSSYPWSAMPAISTSDACP